MENTGIPWFVHDRLDADDGRLRRKEDLRTARSEQVLAFTVIPHQLALLQALQTAPEGRCPGRLQSYIFPSCYSQTGDIWFSISNVRATKDRTNPTDRLRNLATEIIGPNSEDGVVRYLAASMPRFSPAVSPAPIAARQTLFCLTEWRNCPSLSDTFSVRPVQTPRIARMEQTRKTPFRLVFYPGADTLRNLEQTLPI